MESKQNYMHNVGILLLLNIPTMSWLQRAASSGMQARAWSCITTPGLIVTHSDDTEIYRLLLNSANTREGGRKVREQPCLSAPVLSCHGNPWISMASGPVHWYKDCMQSKGLSLSVFQIRKVDPIIPSALFPGRSDMVDEKVKASHLAKPEAETRMSIIKLWKALQGPMKSYLVATIVHFVQELLFWDNSVLRVLYSRSFICFLLAKEPLWDKKEFKISIKYSVKAFSFFCWMTVGQV